MMLVLKGEVKARVSLASGGGEVSVPSIQSCKRLDHACTDIAVRMRKNSRILLNMCNTKGGFGICVLVHARDPMD